MYLLWKITYEEFSEFVREKKSTYNRPMLQCTYKVPSDGEHTTKKKHPQKSSLDFKRQ